MSVARLSMITCTIILLALGVPAKADDDLNGKINHRHDDGYSGTMRVRAKSSGTINIGGSLEDVGSIIVENNVSNLTIKIGDGRSQDLDGKIVIGDNCKGITIDVADVVDTSGLIQMGDNCEVTIKVRDIAKGKLRAGKNSTIRLSAKPDRFDKATGEGTTINNN